MAIIAGIYLVLSAITFAAYGIDKRRAQRDQWRIAEGNLHLLEVLGGWPGAYVAQRVFRHKTRKIRYQIVFWLAVVANVFVMIMVNWSL